MKRIFNNLKLNFQQEGGSENILETKTEQASD